MDYEMPNKEHELLTTQQAAEFLKMSVSWINKDRHKEKPKIPFVKIGDKSIRYRRSDLVAYLKTLDET